MRRAALAILLLTGLYVAVIARSGPADLLFAAIVSGVALYVWRDFLFGGRPDPTPRLLRRVVAFAPFAGIVLRDVLTGTWQVALIVLHLRPLGTPGMVTVPVGERTSTGVAVSALVSGLSPGTVFIAANDSVMLFHIIDATDPDAVREIHEYFYQRYQKKVFP